MIRTRCVDANGRTIGSIARPQSKARVTAGTSSVRVLNENPNRTFALIQADPSNTVSVFIGLGQPAALNYGMILPPGGAFQIDSQTQFTGYIDAIASAVTQYIHVTEG